MHRHRTGRAYRRTQARRNKNIAVKLAWAGYGPGFPNGYLIKDRGKGEYCVSKKNSHLSTFYKRHSNKIIRQSKSAASQRKGQFRKEFDYWYTVN